MGAAGAHRRQRQRAIAVTSGDQPLRRGNNHFAGDKSQLSGVDESISARCLPLKLVRTILPPARRGQPRVPCTRDRLIAIAAVAVTVVVIVVSVIAVVAVMVVPAAVVAPHALVAASVVMVAA